MLSKVEPRAVRAPRRQPTRLQAENRWPPSRIREFWAKRYRIFLKGAENPELVARARRVLAESELCVKLRGGEPVSFDVVLIDAYLRDFHERHAHLQEHYDKFSTGRKRGAVGPIRRAVRRCLEKNPGASTAELWNQLAKNPPRGWTFHDNHAGEYFEGPKGGQNVGFRTVANYASRERTALKIIG
jgi:hypothetical protein